MKFRLVRKRIFLIASMLLGVGVFTYISFIVLGIIDVYKGSKLDRTPQTNDIQWSLSDTVIVFSCYTPLDGSDLYIMDAAKQDILMLTNDSHANTSPHWSPTGLQILFFSQPTNAEFGWQDRDTEIYVVQLDNDGRLIQLTDNDMTESLPQWSPNTFAKIASSVNGHSQ